MSWVLRSEQPPRQEAPRRRVYESTLLLLVALALASLTLQAALNERQLDSRAGPHIGELVITIAFRHINPDTHRRVLATTGRGFFVEGANYLDSCSPFGLDINPDTSIPRTCVPWADNLPTRGGSTCHPRDTAHGGRLLLSCLG